MATKIKPETREVGWVITKVHDTDDTGRIGYGQLLGDAETTRDSYNGVIGRTLFVSRSLTADDIPTPKRVRFRSFSDDGDPAMDGVMNVDWLFSEDDHAYNIDRFMIEDWGATVVLYNAGDIKRCAPDRADWVDRHPRMERAQWVATMPAGVDAQAWLPIYG